MVGERQVNQTASPRNTLEAECNNSDQDSEPKDLCEEFLRRALLHITPSDK
jgi:hypothetical protein